MGVLWGAACPTGLDETNFSTITNGLPRVTSKVPERVSVVAPALFAPAQGWRMQAWRSCKRSRPHCRPGRSRHRIFDETPQVAGVAALGAA